MRWAEQTVWITGASSGIGQAMAMACAAEGARLILSARRLDALEEVRTACGGDARRIQLVPLDLTHAEELPGKALEALAAFGQIDVLIHSAGVSQRALARDTGAQVERTLMEVNYFGPVALTRAVLPSMLKRRSGRIVVLSSLVGKFGMPLRSTYSAAKHALHGYFDSLRAEVREEGIGVTIVCPGFIRTDMPRNALMANGEPQGRMDSTHEHGMDPAVCAAKILDAAGRGKQEVVVGGRETLAVYLHRFLPGVFARVMRRAQAGDASMKNSCEMSSFSVPAARETPQPSTRRARI